MYLDEIGNRKFIGTGEKNQQGEDLNEFLSKYNPNKYQNPCNTVDMLVFSYLENNTKKKVKKILLIKRGNHPCIGLWALPGGFVEYREGIEAAAKRELMEETGIADIEAEQLKSYGDYDRDPRTRIITTAFVALVEEEKVKAIAGDDAKEAEWFDIAYTLIDNLDNNNANSTDIDTKYYKLELINIEKDIKVSAVIEVAKNINKYLKIKDTK